MRMIGVLLLLPCLTAAQALVRGTLLECDASPTGELSIRAADNRVLRYRFDRKTYLERDQQLIDAARLSPGAQLEIVSERLSGYTLNYASRIHVIPPEPPYRSQLLRRLRAYTPVAEPVPRTGNITYSGVVSRLDGQHVVLHTREAGDLSILLRKDTRYLEEGQMVEAEHLKPTMRVFVRAGKDVYQQVEAYQVIWGTILTPR